MADSDDSGGDSAGSSGLSSDGLTYSAIVLESASARELRIAPIGIPEVIGDDTPRFVASWPSHGIVVLAGTKAQEDASLPPAQRLPPPSSHREPVIYGRALAVLTDETGDAKDLTLEAYERFLQESQAAAQ